MRTWLDTETNKKSHMFVFVAILVLLYASVCMETDMYVPAFPQMVKDLGTTEDHIQAVLGINFLGLCISSLWTGPLADSFGRRRTILIGMVLFVSASFGCVMSQSLPSLLVWRFIQGLGAGAPMTAGFAVLMDRYNPKTSATLVGLMNTVITLVVSGAPILGSWVTFHTHWRMNFIVIAVLGSIALLSFYLFIPETLPAEKRAPFRMNSTIRDFKKALFHPLFVAYVMVCTLIFGGIMVFVSNQSLLFLNHLGVSPDVYGYYQSSAMMSFAMGSFISGAVIRKFKVIGAKRICLTLIGVGGMGIIVTALFQPHHALLICMCPSLINLGGGIGFGSIASSAMDLFPEMKATSSGLMGFLRLMIAAGMVEVSSLFFDGTILPIAIIIGGAQFLALFIYWLAHKSQQGVMSASEGSFESTLAVH